jgi:hypothetical protein
VDDWDEWTTETSGGLEDWETEGLGDRVRASPKFSRLAATDFIASGFNRGMEDV